MTEQEGTIGLAPAVVDTLRYERSRNAKTLDRFESDFLIAEMIPMGSRVLEIGCGQGVLMDLLVQMRSVEISGIEPNVERAEVARARGLNVIPGFVSPQLLSSLGVFDVIIFADVLEHLTDPHEMLLMVKDALKANGLIIVSVPNVAHWSVRTSLLFGCFDYQPIGIMDATHLRWFTEKTIKTLIDASGFEVRQIRHSIGYWMQVYYIGFLRLIPGRVKRPLLHLLLTAFPKLFGCQHIVLASVK